jgi:hypothetical protein
LILMRPSKTVGGFFETLMAYADGETGIRR